MIHPRRILMSGCLLLWPIIGLGQTMPATLTCTCVPVSGLAHITLTCECTGHVDTPSPPNPAPGYSGFGADTTGGDGHPTVQVTSCADSGPGSLREAMSQGSRQILFSQLPCQTIHLMSDITVRGDDVTIDGSTAPAALTIEGKGLVTDGHHNIIVTGLRIRNPVGSDAGPDKGNCLVANKGSSRIVWDQISCSGWRDQGVTVNSGAHDVTITRALACRGGASDHNMPAMVSGRDAQHGDTRRVTMAHSVLCQGYERLPRVVVAPGPQWASDTQLDFRYSVVSDWEFSGSSCYDGCKANFRQSYYIDAYGSDNSRKRSIYVCGPTAKAPNCTLDATHRGRAFIGGIVSGDGSNYSTWLNGLSTESAPFAAPNVTPQADGTTCGEAAWTMAHAGAQPRDDIDDSFIASIPVPLRGCP
jgi:hypothetical protein